MTDILIYALPVVIVACLTIAWLDNRRNRAIPNLPWMERRIVIEVSRASQDTPGSACNLEASDAGR